MNWSNDPILASSTLVEGTLIEVEFFHALRQLKHPLLLRLSLLPRPSITTSSFDGISRSGISPLRLFTLLANPPSSNLFRPILTPSFSPFATSPSCSPLLIG
jgi:hypothetical protein